MMICIAIKFRIVLAEKGVNVEIMLAKTEEPSEDLLALNPYGTVPTLIDRDLVLYEARIIMEYLDERFPHLLSYPFILWHERKPEKCYTELNMIGIV